MMQRRHPPRAIPFQDRAHASRSRRGATFLLAGLLGLWITALAWTPSETAAAGEEPAPTPEAGTPAAGTPAAGTPESPPAGGEVKERTEGAGEDAKTAESKRFVRYPHVVVDRERKEVRVEASTSGELHKDGAPLEFLLIRGNDRAYESAFVTQADPGHIWLGLIMTGLKHGPMSFTIPENAPAKRKIVIERSGEAEEAKAEEPEAPQVAPMVDIFIEWMEGEERKRARVESFLQHRGVKAPPPPTPFGFNGSFLVPLKDGRKDLAAKHSNVVIALLYDDSAILNLPYYEPSPYEYVDRGFLMGPQTVSKHFHGEIEIHMKGKQPVIIAKPVTLIFSPSDLPPPETPAKPIVERLKREYEARKKAEAEAKAKADDEGEAKGETGAEGMGDPEEKGKAKEAVEDEAAEEDEPAAETP